MTLNVPLLDNIVESSVQVYLLPASSGENSKPRPKHGSIALKLTRGLFEGEYSVYQASLYFGIFRWGEFRKIQEMDLMPEGGPSSSLGQRVANRQPKVSTVGDHIGGLGFRVHDLRFRVFEVYLIENPQYVA